MNASVLLQWHYLIFLLPLGVAAFLLLLSGLRLGGHRGHYGGMRRAGGHGTQRGHGHSGAGRHSATGRHSVAGQAKGAGHKAAHGGAKAAHTKTAGGKTDDKNDVVTALPFNFMQTLFGVGRAPLPIVLQLMALFWSVAGIEANKHFLADTLHPTLAQMGTPLAIAFWSALIGSRIGAELFGRFMPFEASAVVSREELYGLTGRVVFPVTETGGRIHLYDDNQTLHDERCRIAAGKFPLEKGETARIIDRASDGTLIVEGAG